MTPVPDVHADSKYYAAIDAHVVQRLKELREVEAIDGVNQPGVKSKYYEQSDSEKHTWRICRVDRAVYDYAQKHEPPIDRHHYVTHFMEKYGDKE